MSRINRGWRRLLSHHVDAELTHCYRWGRGRHGVHVCARCLGLYPVLLATLGFEASVWRFESEHRWLLGFSLVIPAVFDWSRSMLFDAAGRNLWRTLTGALAGVGLGLAFGDYFRDSQSGWFWALMGSLTAVVVLVWWVRPRRSAPP